jgi:hypothetical protein
MCLPKYHSMKTYGDVEVQLHVFITWALDGDESASRTSRFAPGDSLDRRLGGLHCRSGRGGEKRKSLPGPCREPNPGHPACSLVTMLKGTWETMKS